MAGPRLTNSYVAMTYVRHIRVPRGSIDFEIKTTRKIEIKSLYLTKNIHTRESPPAKNVLQSRIDMLCILALFRYLHD